MKILFVHHGEVPGGAPTSLRNMLLLLLEHTDFQMKVLCLNEQMKNYFYEETNGKVEVGILPYPCKTLGKVLIWGDIFHWKKFKRFVYDICVFHKSVLNQIEILKIERPNIVHLNSSVLFSTALAARFSSVPIIWHVREVLRGKFWNLRKLLAKIVINELSNKIITISEEVSKNVIYRLRKYEEIHNFIDFRTFRASQEKINDLKRKLDIRKNSKILISLGGVSHHKGTLELVNATKHFEQNTLLVIAGNPLVSCSTSFFRKISHVVEDLLIYIGFKSHYSWYYMERVNSQVKKVDTNRILFTGFLDDIPALIKLSDMLIFSGTTPHFPRPVFEAWALKKPVVVFNMKGIADYIEPGSNGLLVDDINGKSLARAINLVINDEKSLKNMGKNGYCKAKELFNGQKNIKQVIELYSEVLTNSN